MRRPWFIRKWSLRCMQRRLRAMEDPFGTRFVGRVRMELPPPPQRYDGDSPRMTLGQERLYQVPGARS